MCVCELAWFGIRWVICGWCSHGFKRHKLLVTKFKAKSINLYATKTQHAQPFIPEVRHILNCTTVVKKFQIVSKKCFKVNACFRFFSCAILLFAPFPKFPIQSAIYRTEIALITIDCKTNDAWATPKARNQTKSTHSHTRETRI